MALFLTDAKIQFVTKKVQKYSKGIALHFENRQDVDGRKKHMDSKAELENCAKNLKLLCKTENKSAVRPNPYFYMASFARMVHKKTLTNSHLNLPCPEISERK